MWLVLSDPKRNKVHVKPVTTIELLPSSWGSILTEIRRILHVRIFHITIHIRSLHQATPFLIAVPCVYKYMENLRLAIFICVIYFHTHTLSFIYVWTQEKVSKATIHFTPTPSEWANESLRRQLNVHTNVANTLATIN